MENTNIISIEEQEKEDARALTQSFARGDVKSRAYINALGAEVFLKYFEEQNISKERTYNLHNIRKILEEFDISDIKLSNIHIDVRVVFDENQIFIPKTHFEYNLLPDIYVVLKLAKDHSNTEFLGFFEPKLINKNNANDKYYFMEKEKLSSPVDLRNFIENFNRGNDTKYSEEDISHAEFLMVSMTDHDVSEEDKKTLLNYLINSSELRDEFIEYENFEMISYQAASVVGLEPPVNTNEMDVADIPSDEMPSDIAEEMLSASDVESLTENDIVEEQDNKSGDIASDLVKGAAVLGAEIAGTAMASAALSGVEETAESAANIINAAANVANIEADAIDMASSIKNMAEQVFSDESNAIEEHAEVADMPEITEMPAIGNLNIEDFNAELSLNDSQIPLETLEEPELSETVDLPENVEDTSVEQTTDEVSVDQASETVVDQAADGAAHDMGDSVGEFAEAPELAEDFLQNMSEQGFEGEELSLDDLNIEDNVAQPREEFSETSEVQQSEALVEQSDESSLSESSEPQDSMNSTLNELFEDLNVTESGEESQGDDLIFSNSDDLVFENSDDSSDITYTNNNDYGDDLIFESGDDYGDSYGGGNDNYTSNRSSNPLAHGFHTPISEATELTSLEDIQTGNLPKITPPPSNEDQMETMEMEEFHNLVRNYVPQEIKDESETIAFDNVGESSALPINANKGINDEENKELSDFESMPESAERNIPVGPIESDAFVEEMPDAIKDLSASNYTDELTSDNFVEEMPSEISDLSSQDHSNELTSDNFVEEMPSEISDLSSQDHSNELTSDNFVEEMPREISDLSSQDHSNELTSDNFVEEMPDEIKDLSSSDHTDELTSDNFVQDIPGLNVDSVETPAQPENTNPQNQETVTSELSDEANDDISLLEGLDALALGELESEEPQDTSAVLSEGNMNDANIEICETPQGEGSVADQDESKLQVLYDGSTSTELNDLELEPELEEPQAQESYDFRPERKINKLMPVFAILAAIVIAGSVVGFLMKSKNSIDADTLIQTTPENEVLATPEADNSNILANTGDTTLPSLPQDAEDVSPTAPAVPSTPPVAKQEKKEVKPAPQKPAAVKTVAPSRPINGSKTITLKKLSWEVPDYLSYSENIKKYLQTAGKSIKLTLSSDLLLTNEYIYSNQVKVDLKLSKNGDIQSAKIVKSSGSEQVDKIVLRTVKDTLNVVKPARGEVPTPNYNLALIIYL